MEKELKSQIVKVADAVKKKLKDMKTLESDSESMLKQVFKPVTSPLEQLIENRQQTMKTKVDLNDTESNSSIVKNQITAEPQFDKTLKEKIAMDSTQEDESDENSDLDVSYKTIDSEKSQDTLSWSLSSDVFEDVPYGVRKERGKLMMGSSRVKLNNDTITVGTHVYGMTVGLYELLFKKVPNLDLVTERDSQDYKHMLIETNAHRRDFDPHKPIKANKGRKYLNLIKPLFKLRKPSTSSISSSVDNVDTVTEGEGIILKKRYKKNTDYVYWDDPNELVERLRLLIASKSAGNTGLDNEIISIIEELREGGIIN